MEPTTVDNKTYLQQTLPNPAGGNYPAFLQPKLIYPNFNSPPIPNKDT